ncbi:MAG: HEPN domain-containing protein [Opitutus sp.]|nr:HEPN domain-containing protein [Opitutus sp.]
MSDPASKFQAWVAKAEEDRLCIRNNLAAAAVPWAVVCFHAQQAAEKYLKAFLVFKGDRVERTHDLEIILQACVRHDADLQTLLPDCDTLTAYAVDARYPDMLSEDAEKIAREAVRKCDTICTTVAQRFPS